MRIVLLAVAAFVATTLWLPAASRACGDKLVVLGRGVRLERLHLARHPGSIVVYMSPRSALPGADREFHFSAALELAGHEVEIVSNRSDLDRALRAKEEAVVLADLIDAQELRREVSGSDWGILPLLFKPTSEQVAEARGTSPCLGQVAKRRNRELLAVVDEMMGKLQRGEPVECSSSLRKSP